MVKPLILTILITTFLFIASPSNPTALSELARPPVTTETENDFAYYRDNKYPFSARYPKDWTRVSIASDSITRLSVESQDKIDLFTINVIGALGLKQPSPREFVAEALKTDYAALIRPKYPDVTILESGETSISNQEAFYWIFRATVVRYDVRMSAVMMQVQTTRAGNIYTLGCGTAAERYNFPRKLDR